MLLLLNFENSGQVHLAALRPPHLGSLRKSTKEEAVNEQTMLVVRLQLK